MLPGKYALESFNPRTYIRYDTYRERLDSFNPVSIHVPI